MFWMIEAILIAIVRALQVVLSFIIKSVLTPIELSTDLFLTYFWSINNFLPYIKAIGILLATGIFVFQMIKHMFYQTAASQTDSSFGMTIKYVIAIALVFSCINIGTFAFNLTKIAFSTSGIINSGNSSEISEQVDQTIDNIDSQVSDYTKKMLNESGMNDFYYIGMAVGVITLILIVGLFISYIAFIFKIFIRYVLTCVCLYLSPIASATIVSINTTAIFRKYLELIVSNMLLLFIDFLFLRIMIVGLKVAFTYSKISGLYNPLLSVTILMGFASVATTIDAKLGNILSAVAGTPSLQRDIMFSMGKVYSTLTGHIKVGDGEEK